MNDKSPCLRTIMHLDMDAFFASVEQADNPELRGLPVVIGQSPRGVASAASYEARRFGIRSAMPIVQAQKLCPQAVFLPGRMSRYREVSRQIMAIIHAHCPVVEKASVDEAYADISGLERFQTPETLAWRLKGEILTHTQLTCSIGLAPNKFLAKIASDWNKPGGLTIIAPQDIPTFLAALPLRKIPGVGARMLEKLALLGAKNIPDILAHSRAFWVDRFGVRGDFLYDRAQGLDPSPVTPHVEPKSCSAENTLEADTQDRALLERWLLIQAERVGRELRQMKKKGLTVTLKLKFNDFTSITRSTTLPRPTDVTTEILATTKVLLGREKFTRPVRLIGTGVSNFQNQQAQLPLIPDPARQRAQTLDQTLDRIRDKFGNTSILRADAAKSESETDRKAPAYGKNVSGKQ